MNKRIITGVILLVLAVSLAGCRGAATGVKSTPASPPSPSEVSPTSGFVQTSSEGGVTIAVSWQGQAGNSLVFNVAMDTHSGSIDQYNLKDLAVLRDSSGKEYLPTGWDAPAGGHHRTGTLTFPVTESFDLETLTYLEMIIRDVAGVGERSLRWRLN